MIYTLIIGNVFFFNKRNNKSVETEEEEERKNKFLCRFVVDGSGRRIGESISLDGDVVIIKSKNTFLGVPLKHIEEKEKNLLVKGLVDTDKAIEMGEKWRKESFNEFDQSEGKEDE